MGAKKRNIIEETIEAPAKILESSFEGGKKLADKVPGSKIHIKKPESTGTTLVQA